MPEADAVTSVPVSASPCPACTQTDYVAASPIPGVVDTCRCRTCGLIVADHKTRVDAGYEFLDDEAYGQSVAATRARQAADVVTAVADLGTPLPRRWVDVGCGPGVLLTKVREAGFETVGLEPDAIAADQAQAAVDGLELHRSILVDGLLPDASAAVVSTMDVLEHVPADELHDFADRVRRALVPGGVWVIKLPTSDGPYFRTANVVRRFSRRLPERFLRRLWQTDYAYPHTVYFDRRSLGVFLGSAGFEVESATYPQEVALATALSRLRMDPTVPSWQALMALPVVIALNACERVYGKTDALLLLARRR